MSTISKIKNNDSFFSKEEEQLKVLVQFRPIIGSKKQLTDEIQQLSNPQVILWFLEKELRVDWFEYLCDDLIGPIRADPKCLDPIFFLYDLGKWLLFSQKCDKTKLRISSKIQKVREFNCPDIKFLYSAEFFQFLKSTSQQLKEYVNNVIWKQRPFIWKISTKKLEKEPPKSNITIQESFRGKTEPLLENILDRTAKGAYSGLQYLEGYFLIRKILEENKFKPGDDINIVFLLPNNEYQYYQNEDDLEIFGKDVCEMLRIERPSFTKGQITITFIPFEWNENGKNPEEARPYKPKAGQAIITNNNLELLTRLKI